MIDHTHPSEPALYSLPKPFPSQTQNSPREAGSILRRLNSHSYHPSGSSNHQLSDNVLEISKNHHTQDDADSNPRSTLGTDRSTPKTRPKIFKRSQTDRVLTFSKQVLSEDISSTKLKARQSPSPSRNLKFFPLKNKLSSERRFDILADRPARALDNQNDLSLEVPRSQLNDFLELSDEVPLIMNPRLYRRKSCTCLWCGGSSSLEKDIQNYPGLPTELPSVRLRIDLSHNNVTTTDNTPQSKQLSIKGGKKGSKKLNGLALKLQQNKSNFGLASTKGKPTLQKQSTIDLGLQESTPKAPDLRTPNEATASVKSLLFDFKDHCEHSENLKASSIVDKKFPCQDGSDTKASFVSLVIDSKGKPVHRGVTLSGKPLKKSISINHNQVIEAIAETESIRVEKKMPVPLSPVRSSSTKHNKKISKKFGLSLAIGRIVSTEEDLDREEQPETTFYASKLKSATTEKNSAFSAEKIRKIYTPTLKLEKDSNKTLSIFNFSSSSPPKKTLGSSITKGFETYRSETKKPVPKVLFDGAISPYKSNHFKLGDTVNPLSSPLSLRLGSLPNIASPRGFESSRYTKGWIVKNNAMQPMRQKN